MTTEDYKYITWTLIMSLWIFGRFKSDKISRKRIWMICEDEERGGERDVESGLRSDRVELSRKMKLSKSDEESWLSSYWFASKSYSSTEEIDVSLVWYLLR